MATLGDKPAQAVRRDIVPTTNPDLSQAMLGAFKKTGALGGRAARLDVPGGVAAGERQKRIDMRKDLLESPASDPMGYERIIGESDLTSINYLDRGRRAAAAVCRIRVPADGGEWYGTGFLVGPRLLLTNQHVLGNVSEASQAEAEFGYEHDLDGVLQRPAQFNLRPHEIFFTDPELDITFVAISPFAESGVPIERYGWLPLLPLPGKIVDKEWVTIIQHPGGGPKQISIRSSRIVSLAKKDIPTVNLDHFIHYLTDTEPGSSGSPVVNDQWQVIALHHKAVPKPHSKASDGKPAVFIGNEGVRVSAIYKTLERRRLESDEARRVLDRLDAGFGFLPITQVLPAGEEDTFEKDAKPYAASRWKKAPGIGYDPSFLSEAIRLQDIYKKARESGETAPLKDDGGDELTYHRFSIVVHKTRKFALLTAVNIHGGLLQHPGKRQSTWRQDERMDPEYQPAGDFYEKEKGTDKIQFSRGHLVRRFDPSWGDTVDDAKLGDEDSFHYANAAPQFQAYNDIDWGNLEDYVLNRAQTTEKKMTVFQGPIFRDDDPLYGKNRKGGPWKIPLSFWKIAVLEKAPGQIAAAAFMIGQTQYVGALYEAKVFSGLRPYRLDDMRSRKIQTTIKTIEAETGLDFAAIRRFDAHGSLESTRQTRWINRLSDVQI